MKRTIFVALSALAVLMAMPSCDDEAKYEAPRGLSLSLSPNPCAPGDTVTAVVAYASAGDNWYWASESSRFAVPSGSKWVPVAVGFDKVNYVLGACTSETFCKFRAPATPGSYSVSFSGRPSITAGSNEYGGLYGEQMNCSATLTVK